MSACSDSAQKGWAAACLKLVTFLDAGMQLISECLVLPLRVLYEKECVGDPAEC